MKKSYEINMCEGPLFSRILIFAIPLVLSGILQLLFNAADIVVVGRYAGNGALAAVGSTTSLINLLVNLFLGLSNGATALAARYYGAKDDEGVKETVHTSMALAVAGGLLMAFIGFFFSQWMLTVMATPPDVIGQAVLYMQIYFLGMPAFMIYNFGAAILRAFGDTKRPLYYLLYSGIINVIFNLVFVIMFKMDVAGVAVATVISEAISAYLVVRCLMKTEGMFHLDLKKIRFHRDKFAGVMIIGLPAGLQGVVFNISNVLVQSSVNSFGSIVMAGNGAAFNVEGFVFTSMTQVYQTCLSFTSQNYGAKKFKRMDKVLIDCLIIVTMVGLVMGKGAYRFGHFLLGIYSSDPLVIEAGLERMAVVSDNYFICGCMDTTVGSLQGMGCSVLPMIVSFVGTCAFRVIWILTVFAKYHTQYTLYLTYPLSWALMLFFHVISFFVVRHKVREKARLDGTLDLED